MLTRNRIDEIILKLFQEQFAPGSQDEYPQDGYGCAPVCDSFMGYIHPSRAHEAEKCNGFIPVESYPVQPLKENEIGAVGNMRILISNKVDRSEIVVKSVTHTQFKIQE